MLHCKNLCFAYKDTEVLKNIHLDVKGGEITTIMGRSGCGKTTLLHIFNSILKPTHGTFSHNASCAVTIFQDKRLIPWQSIGNNIRFGAKTKGIYVNEEKVEQALLDVGLPPHLKNAYPKVLSGGMMQRVAIARALICTPDIIFMDEPFCALDGVTKRDLMYKVANYIQANNAAGILVTHDRYEAASLSSNVYELKGNPAKLYFILSLKESLTHRNEKTKVNIMDKIFKQKQQSKAECFVRHGVVEHSNIIESFIDYMNNLGWRFVQVDNAQKPLFDKQPDCIILSSKNPHAKEIFDEFKDKITRFLWIDKPLEQISAKNIAANNKALLDWWGWENIYEDFIATSTNSIIEDILIGHNWSFVRTKDAAGLARCPSRGTEGPRSIPNAGDLIGEKLFFVAKGLTSGDSLQRSLAIASLACVHNNLSQKNDMANGGWGFAIFKESMGEKACIGHFPFADNILPDMKVIEREPKKGHYTVEQGEEILQNVESVIITAQTFMNGSLPRLLFLAQRAEIMLLGPTALLSCIWKKYGIRYVCGAVIKDINMTYNFIAQAGACFLEDKNMIKKITLEF